MRSVVIKSIDKEHVRQCMDQYAERMLGAHPEVEEIVVFGSFAEGRFVPGSDIDIFVLLKDSNMPVRDRIPDYLPGPFPVGVDIFPYTRQEVEALKGSTLLEAVSRSRWRYRRSV